MKKYIYAVLILLVIFVVAIYIIPVAFLLVRFLIGLAILAVFGAGIWLATLFNKKTK